MICEPCMEGADLAELAIGRITPRSVALAATLGRAARLHGECRGGTWCDCQHRPPEQRS